MKPDNQANKEIAKKAFAEIQKACPDLHAVFDGEQTGHIDCELIFPVQDGLEYQVCLNLQNDELHLNVSHFWVEWFPCTDNECMKRYIDAVSGFLSGEYRVVEYFRGKKYIKSKLQKPQDGKWNDMAGHYGSLFPFFSNDMRIIRNK